MKIDLKRNGTIIDDDILMGPCRILFRLVILRNYLSRTAADDEHIFQLVMARNICRVLTAHEQALAAYRGQTDTSVYEHPISNNTPWNRVKLIPDVKLTLGTSSLCVVRTPNLPYNWPNSTSSGLTGGPSIVRYSTAAQSAASTPAKQRPVPKPARRKDRTAGSKQKTDNTVVKPSVGASTTGRKRKAVEELTKSEKRVMRSSRS
jgi:hypothetical protein